MVYSVSLEDNSPSRYTLKVMDELIWQAQILGVEPTGLIEFLSNQVKNMFLHKPNYNAFGQKAKVWIMRGYYPDTPLFFKLIVLPDTCNGDDGRYYAKATPLRIHGLKTYSKGEGFHLFDGHELDQYLVDSMENALLGAKHKVKPLMPDSIRMPRCMSPKGMPVFKYKKPRKQRAKSK